MQELKELVKEMQLKLKDTRALVAQLSSDKILCEKRLINAGKLIDLLSEEGKRWENTIAEMESEVMYKTGNILLSAVQLNYLGPFD